MADQANIFGNGNPQQAPASQEPTAQPQEPQQTVPNEPSQQQAAPQQQQQAPQQAPAPAQPQLPPEVANVVGEGKKYASVEAALASVPHAQNHISQLEQENQTLKQQLEEMQGKVQQATTADDILAQITASQKPDGDQPVQTAGLDEQAVLQLLEKREAAKRAEQNQTAVTKELVTKYGDETKAVEALQTKAEELGVDFDYMKELAARSPKAVLTYFDVQSKPNENKVVPTSNSVSTAQYQGNQQQQYDCSVSHLGTTTEDLVNAMRNAGRLVTGGEDINHYL